MSAPDQLCFCQHLPCMCSFLYTMWCVLEERCERGRGTPAHLVGRQLGVPLLQGLSWACATGRPGPGEGGQQQMDPCQQVWAEPEPGFGRGPRTVHWGLGHEPGCEEENAGATPARLCSLRSRACIRRLGNCQQRGTKQP